MAEGCSLLILAGGNSRRMGRDKATLSTGRETLVEHIATRLAPVVDEVLVSLRQPRAEFGGVPTVVDRVVGMGPLGGMHAGFLAARHPLVWVVACDLPDVEPSLGSLLRDRATGVDAAVPQAGDQLEGVCAIYRGTVARTIEDLLHHGHRSVRALLDTITVRVVGEDELRRVDPGLRSFRNLNTPGDYADWLALKRSS
ncbi:MAG TPA: molybdenum cofactor guanylyltransferase [Candidatus Dormibacteraeota bacterium]